ncbi:NAD(P)-dependent oxidoreductase [Candidatus Woesearchaeota archaeon]|nr:NAD(P)-dependent oxidoreductase [Candidatus Woesearchaeota archaeon]
MKKVFITGGSGVVGSALARFLSRDYRVFASYNRSPPKPFEGVEFVQLDITDRGAVSSVVRSLNPEIIVHAAALKDVRFCEANPETARRVNVDGTANLASSCDAFFVYVSTDYVFDGSRGMYSEGAVPSPWTVYGKTKLQGEVEVASLCSRYAVCRTSGIYSLAEGNILQRILGSFRQGKVDSYFTDVFNSATNLGNFCRMLGRVIGLGETGTYHLAGSERISRYGFALKVADTFKFGRSLVLPLELGEARRRAELRPFDLSLDIAQSQKRLGIGFFGVEEGLAEIKNEADALKGNI